MPDKEALVCLQYGIISTLIIERARKGRVLRSTSYRWPIRSYASTLRLQRVLQSMQLNLYTTEIVWSNY